MRLTHRWVPTWRLEITRWRTAQARRRRRSVPIHLEDAFEVAALAPRASSTALRQVMEARRSRRRRCAVQIQVTGIIVTEKLTHCTGTHCTSVLSSHASWNPCATVLKHALGAEIQG